MMSVDFRRVCLFYKVLALLSRCPSLCTLDPSPGDAEHPQPSLTQAHGSAHIKFLTLQRSCLRWPSVGRKGVWLLPRIFQASTLTPGQMIPRPGSPVLQDTTMCRQWRAWPSELRHTSRGWGTSPTHSGALRHPVYRFGQTVARFYRKAVTFLPTVSTQLLHDRSFPAWTCIPAPRDPFYLPHQHLQGPTDTKLPLLRHFKNKTTNSKNPYRPSGKGGRCAAWGESNCREQLFISLQQ